MRLPVRACLAVAFLSAAADAQPLSRHAIALATERAPETPTVVVPFDDRRDVINRRHEQASWRPASLPLFETPRHPLTRQEPHDGNHAKRGAIIGALTTGVASAIIVGLFAKRDCEPGLCGSEFQRGALVGGGVGLAAGGVLGWLIGSEIAKH